MGDFFIEFSNVDFSYANHKIIRDLSFTIDQGEFVSIIGGSGSGKTTLLKLISGVLQPTRGVIKIKGTPLAQFSQKQLYEYRREMGFLFQTGALFTGLTVYDNIAFPIRELTKFPEKLVHTLVLLKLEVVGLRGTEYLYPAELSGGMLKRVALARALVLDPTLLLFDEPFAGLDPISLGSIAHLIARINNSLNATSIMVTHDMTASLSLVNKVLFLSSGSIEFMGTVSEMEKSDSALLKQFITGSVKGPVDYKYPNSINFLDEILKINEFN